MNRKTGVIKEVWSFYQVIENLGLIETDLETLIDGLLISEEYANSILVLLAKRFGGIWFFHSNGVVQIIPDEKEE